jgi:hypothetical protein
LEFKEENADIKNISDDRRHSFPDFFAGKFPYAKLGIKSVSVRLPGCLAGDNRAAALLLVEDS